MYLGKTPLGVCIFLAVQPDGSDLGYSLEGAGAEGAAWLRVNACRQVRQLLHQLPFPIGRDRLRKIKLDRQFNSFAAGVAIGFMRRGHDGLSARSLPLLASHCATWLKIEICYLNADRAAALHQNVRLI